ncbi:hypothetical protein [Streptomyces mirabilis]
MGVPAGEGGTSTPMLLARSRHASVRSLERPAGGADASKINYWRLLDPPR